MDARALSTKPYYGAVPSGLPDVKLPFPSLSVQAGIKNAPQQGSWFKSRVLVILVSVLASAFVVAITPRYRPSIEESGARTTRSCTLDECGHSRCNATHPYICVDSRQPYFNPLILGGCKATPWNSVLSCADSCSLSNCPKATSESAERPVRKCTFDECKYAAMCDATHPFVCIGPQSQEVCKATMREVSVHCADACSISHCSEAFPDINS